MTTKAAHPHVCKWCDRAYTHHNYPTFFITGYGDVVLTPTGHKGVLIMHEIVPCLCKVCNDKRALGVEKGELERQLGHRLRECIEWDDAAEDLTLEREQAVV